ncbi:MAG TPA: ATP-binding protein [Allosphingosinicella sp.]
MSENFYTSELPRPAAAADMYAKLAVPPLFDESERLLEPSLRRVCVMRLNRYLKPGVRHLKLAEGFLHFLIEGYDGRGRVRADHEARIRAFAAERAAGTLLDVDVGSQSARPRALMTSKPIGTKNTAGSAVLLGMAGMGKSLTVEEILNHVPEVVEHTSPLTLRQVVWMKLDCPHKGSVRALCRDFFHEMDRILGERRYVRTYAGSRATEESMMSDMALLANLHALGVLVIDEIQHLALTRSDAETLLAFLVTLINKIGVPVMLVGTNDASDIMSRTLRLGRRSTGIGSDTWERYSADDDEWIAFIEDLWGYQWTNVHTDLDADGELMRALYDETQGIVDLAVKLFMLAQMRAIRRGEALGGEERITPTLLRRVAREEFAIVRPLIEALRSGDRRRIARYGDMSPLRDHFTRILQAETGKTDLELPKSRPGCRGTQVEAEEANDKPGNALFREVFRQLGAAEDVGREILNEARSQDPDADVWALLELVRARLGPRPPAKPRASRKGRTLGAPGDYEEGDLRRVVAAGAADGLSPYRSLADAGITGPGALFRAS